MITLNILLRVSTAADGNKIAIFIFLLLNKRYQFLIVSQNIYESNVEFDNRCYFKHLNFYVYGFFRTVSGRLFRVTFIPGSENCKSYENFFFIFSISIKLFFMVLRSSFFEIFGKLQWRNSMIGFMFCYTAGLRSWDVFVGIFWNFKNKNRQSNCERPLVICEKLLLILKYYFKYINFII